jgi:hypothetical protein
VPVQAAPPVPAPAAPPAPAPAPPARPQRPGGAPPGTELVALPGGNNVSLNKWLSSLDKECKKAGYPPRCLKPEITFTDPDGNPLPKTAPRKNCQVSSQDPGMGEKVTTSTRVSLEVSCEAPSAGN